MVQTFLVALIAAICRSDRPFFGMMMLHRPLIVSTLVGIIFGDIKTGIIFGAQMELLSMGLVGIGSASGMPEITLGSALCTAFICRNGVNSELALAMALPISSFAVTLGYITWTHVMPKLIIIHMLVRHFLLVLPVQWKKKQLIIHLLIRHQSTISRLL